MIKGAVELRRFLLLDGSVTGGVIETDMPEAELKELLESGNFKYKKRVLVAVKEKGYNAF